MFDAKKMVRLGLALADFVMSLPAMNEFVLSRIYRKTKDRPITLTWRLV
jgi:hypothetical protein